MDNVNKLILTTLGSALTIMTLSTSTVALADDASEKCYGIVKKGMNDCQTSQQSCASSATKDNQPDAFLFVPKGLCDKIVGGHLTPPTTDKK